MLNHKEQIIKHHPRKTKNLFPFPSKGSKKKNNYQLIGMNFNRIKSFQWLQGLIVDICQEIDKQNKDENEI